MANKEKNNDKKVKKHVIKDFKAELKRVTWPTPKQLTNSTIAVVTIVLILAVICFILDSGFELANKYGITKLQSQVIESVNKNNTNNENSENEQEQNAEEQNQEEQTDGAEDTESAENSETNSNE